MSQHQNFLHSFIQRIGVGRLDKKTPHPEGVIKLCHQLVSNNSETTSFSLAKTILENITYFTEEQKKSFFYSLLNQFSVDKSKIKSAITELNFDDEKQLRNLQKLVEPKSQELLRRLNQVPNGTEILLKIRESLLESIKDSPELKPLDTDFLHLFRSWFNRGFLRLERIDWSTSAQVLEKIMEYEAVHDISDWDDLQNRVAAPDKRLYAFFHPALPNEPLIFIEVALMNGIPNSINSILNRDVEPINPLSATTATFYSISNCQMGLKNVSFGSFLIKQVVAEIEQEFKQIKQFITLSPVPGLKKWANNILLSEDKGLSENTLEDIKECCGNRKPSQIALARLTYHYLTQVKRKNGQAFNPVAHFHLGNGASLYKIHTEANNNEMSLEDSWGVMVNYLYDLDSVTKNHEDYANSDLIAASPKLKKTVQNNQKKVISYSI